MKIHTYTKIRVGQKYQLKIDSINFLRDYLIKTLCAMVLKIQLNDTVERLNQVIYIMIVTMDISKKLSDHICHIEP